MSTDVEGISREWRSDGRGHRQNLKDVPASLNSFPEIPPDLAWFPCPTGSPLARCCKQACFQPSSWDTRPPSHSGSRKCMGQLLSLPLPLFHFVCRNFILRAMDLFLIRSSTFLFKKDVSSFILFFQTIFFYFTIYFTNPICLSFPSSHSSHLLPHPLLREEWGINKVISLEGGPRPSSCI